jgi:replicative DNA helicase
MSAADIANRGLAEIVFDRRQRIPYTNIASGDVTEAQFRTVDDAARKRREWPLQIDPAPGLTVSQIAARARTDPRTPGQEAWPSNYRPYAHNGDVGPLFRLARQ